MLNAFKDPKDKKVARTSHLMDSKKQKDLAKKRDAELYGHLDELSTKMLKKSITTGIKTALDSDITMRHLRDGTPNFDVKGSTFSYRGYKVSVNESFADFYVNVMCDMAQKTYARAVICRNNPEDRGRSHSRVLPPIVCNISGDVAYTAAQNNSIQGEVVPPPVVVGGGKGVGGSGGVVDAFADERETGSGRGGGEGKEGKRIEKTKALINDMGIAYHGSTNLILQVRYIYIIFYHFSCFFNNFV